MYRRSSQKHSPHNRIHLEDIPSSARAQLEQEIYEKVKQEYMEQNSQKEKEEKAQLFEMMKNLQSMEQER